MSKSGFSKDLLEWYYLQSHNMPWRGTLDPYHIWLSEVMLQQTQVQTVKPYYHRWLEKYPSVEDVADADENELLKVWEGLGYYARARNFQHACRTVVDEFNGAVPDQPDQFMKLKGVGPYTNAAVQSIAFQHSLPVVDGNVKRIASRIMKLETPPDKHIQTITNFLTQHIPEDVPGDFNQALMDLGRQICTAATPKCNRCPVAQFCRAYVDNVVDKYPVKIQTKEKPHVNIAVGVIWKSEEVLIAKRKSSGLLGGLWEFPGGKIEPGENAESCVLREVKEELGLDVKLGAAIGAIEHAYSHFSLTMTAYNCQYTSGIPQAISCADWCWLDRDQFDRLAFPKANHKLFPLIPDENPFCK